MNLFSILDAIRFYRTADINPVRVDTCHKGCYIACRKPAGKKKRFGHRYPLKQGQIEAFALSPVVFCKGIKEKIVTIILVKVLEALPASYTDGLDKGHISQAAEESKVIGGFIPVKLGHIDDARFMKGGYPFRVFLDKDADSPYRRVEELF